MKVSGYTIQDRMEELKQQLSRANGKLSNINQYFESEGPANDLPIVTLAEEIGMLEGKIAGLGTTQMIYNIDVMVPELQCSLQEAIKQVAGLKRMHAVWTNLASQASSISGRASTYFGYKDTEEKREYPKAVISADACTTEAERYLTRLRQFKRILRTANATEIEYEGIDHLFT